MRLTSCQAGNTKAFLAVYRPFVPSVARGCVALERKRNYGTPAETVYTLQLKMAP